MPEYLFILIVVFFVTLSLHTLSRVKLYTSLRHFLIFNIVNLFLAVIWDQFAIYRGHWHFESRFLVGVNIGFMPIEEFLFVLVVSYFAIVLYKVIEKWS